MCVVGGGAAGITVALELEGSGLRVVLLESGGFEPDGRTQSLYEGAVEGQAYLRLDACRLRYLGGTTNHWGGWCRPLTEADFRPRGWIPHSGWPIDRAELDPHYRRAHEILRLGPYDYGPAYWEGRGLGSPLPLRPDRFRTQVIQFPDGGAVRFGTDYREPLRRSREIRVFLHSNATGFRLRRDTTAVGRCRAATLAGNGFEISGRVFVLAAGGIENPRLLLASDSDRPKGLGNGHDLVGRFFMEHPEFTGGYLLPLAPRRQFFLYRQRESRSRRVRGALIAAAEHLRRERCAGFSATLDALETGETSELFSPGYASARAITQAVAEGRRPESFETHVRRAIGDLDSFAIGLYRTIRGGQQVHRVHCAMEQAPDPGNRIMLTRERDVLGLPRVKLRWNLGDLERRTMRKGVETLATELGHAGLGRVQVPPDQGFWLETMRWGSHHMGTTRMAKDPRSGVVDEHCRVHELTNLFVAGSSVFPTGGIANPTLTLTALAVRLAGHIRRYLG